MEPVVPSIIEEMEQYKPIPYATTWQRFANYLIDCLACYVLFIILVFILAVISELTQVDLVYVFTSEEAIDKLFAYLAYYVLFFIAFFLSEGLFKGRTLGKLITGTRAVKQDNSPMTWKDAARRSVSRLIPFEQFSGFGGDGFWHDRLSKTMVVKTRG